MELEPGVTVVVGPNGSGKSNVVDAIAWVLGAQAPSAVRSQKMDDVIFAGTSQAHRARSGRGQSDARQLRRAAPDRVHRGHGHPHPVPHRRERVRHQRRPVPPARHPGAAVRRRGRPPAARDRQPGPDRCRAQRPARGPPGDHRRSRRRAQVPQAQGEGRAPPRLRPRATCCGSRTCCARSAASCVRSSARPRRPVATATWSPSCRRPQAVPRRPRDRRAPDPADHPRHRPRSPGTRPNSELARGARPARHRRAGDRGRAHGPGRHRPRRLAWCGSSSCANGRVASST